MRIRARLTLKNHAMIEARQALNMNQIEVAKIAGVPIGQYQRLESLDMRLPGHKNLPIPKRREKMEEIVRRVAYALGVGTDQVVPNDSMFGIVVPNKYERIIDSEPEALMAWASQVKQRMIEMDPADAAEVNDSVEDLLSSLPQRRREIIERRFGLNGRDPQTHEQVGQELGCTGERVRQVETGAIKSMFRYHKKKELKARIKQLVSACNVTKSEPMD